MHHGQWVPVYTGQSSSELQRPLCPTSYMAQGPLLMAPWLLAATSWAPHCSEPLSPASPLPCQCWCRGQEEREPRQPTRASSCASDEGALGAGWQIGSAAATSHVSRALQPLSETALS